MGAEVTRSPKQRRFAERYGPWAVVTGASDGIGRAIAVELARDGLSLVLVARRGRLLEALAAELEARFGAQTQVVVADLGEDAEIARVHAETEALDVGLLVAAAGFGTSGDFLEGDVDAELNMVDVNCRAVVRMSHVFGWRVANRGRGGLLLFSSLLAFQGVPRAACYAATKAFIQSLAEGLRRELGPRGVDVLSAAPGPVASGFAARADMQMGMSLEASAIARPTLDALGRWTTVRPGWLSWFLELALSTVPRWARTRILEGIMGGFTAHQRAPRALASDAGA